MAEGSDAITGKFDFYDVLGYLVPGLVLVGLLSLPFGVIKGSWPSTTLTSAVLYLVGAHILGHILQGFLRAWEIVPEIRDDNGKLRAPSSALLDESPKSLAPAVRAKIRKLANRYWEIPQTPGVNDGSWADVPDPERAAAFLQARNLLLQAKKQSYFEQFEGKYALMGGMAACLLVAAVYYAGWALGLAPSGSRSCADWLGHALAPYLVFFGIYCVVVQALSGRRVSPATQKVVNLVLLLSLAFGAFVGGFVVGSVPDKPQEAQKASQTEKAAEAQKGALTSCAVCCVNKCESSEDNKASSGLQIQYKASFMLILALVAFAAGVRSYGAYKAFATEFAKGAWRDFANYDVLSDSDNKGGGGGAGGAAPGGTAGAPVGGTAGGTPAKGTA